MSNDCKCGEPVMHAKAVESAIFQCLQNAQAGDEDKWRMQADKLEKKFTTGHGRHYGDILYPR